MKRIINILVFVAIPMMFCGCIPQPDNPDKDHVLVNFHFRKADQNYHYKIALFSEQQDSTIIDLHTSNDRFYRKVEVVKPIDVAKNNPIAQYESPWHYAMATYLGGVTHCEIYQLDYGSPLGWEGLDGKTPLYTFRIGDNQPNSIFNPQNWDYGTLEGYYAYEILDYVEYHRYTYTIPEPLEE